MRKKGCEMLIKKAEMDILKQMVKTGLFLKDALIIFSMEQDYKEIIFAIILILQYSNL